MAYKIVFKRPAPCAANEFIHAGRTEKPGIAALSRAYDAMTSTVRDDFELVETWHNGKLVKTLPRPDAIADVCYYKRQLGIQP